MQNRFQEVRTETCVTKYRSSKKQMAFEYVVIQMAKWWIEMNPNKDFTENDLTILKVMKLLYFMVASSTTLDNLGLLSVFGEWWSLPYGHQEMWVTDLIRHNKGEFTLFTISNGPLVLK